MPSMPHSRWTRPTRIHLHGNLVHKTSDKPDGAFSRFDFTFDKRRNLYICPAGKTLTTTGRVAADNGIQYRAAVPDCRACPLKPSCCPGMAARRIVRDLDEDARDVARQIGRASCR